MSIFDQLQLSDIARRSFLQTLVGSCLSSVGCAVQARSQFDSPSPIRSCIFLMHYGGPSHLDTWDMKPTAPAEVRGEYQSISTSVPGRFVCEHLPLMARLVHKVALIRSMHHSMTNHNAAMYEALIGRVPAGGDKELLGVDRLSDFPSLGSVMSFLAEQGQLAKLPDSDLPLTNVALPYIMKNVVELAGQNAGFLGGHFDPFQLNGNPNQSDFQCRQLTLDASFTVERLQQRRRLLTNINSDYNRSLADFRNRAFELLLNARVQQAFRLSSEPDAVRNRYGRNELGQSLLLARRLVEAGVRFINVNDRQVNGQDVNWDSHEKIFPRHRELLQPVDFGLSALLEDLDARGLLESTLVVSMGEFGRTPKINSNAGRDHWPNCFHVLLAGGGVVEGATVGTSDSIGAFPEQQPVTPGDLTASIISRFGVSHEQIIHDRLGRPFRLADGQPIQGLFSV